MMMMMMLLLTLTMLMHLRPFCSCNAKTFYFPTPYDARNENSRQHHTSTIRGWMAMDCKQFLRGTGVETSPEKIGRSRTFILLPSTVQYSHTWLYKYELASSTMQPFTHQPWPAPPPAPSRSLTHTFDHSGVWSWCLVALSMVSPS